MTYKAQTTKGKTDKLDVTKREKKNVCFLRTLSRT